MKKILKMIILGMIVTASMNVFATGENESASQVAGATICDSDLIQDGTTGTTGIKTKEKEVIQE